MTAKLSLAHSPDADDAFMFYALATGLVDTGDLEYEHELQDIETLNGRVIQEELDVSAISIHAYAYASRNYVLLPHGFAMGERYGPRIVAREPLGAADLEGLTIAVPGRLTSAHLALRLLEPNCMNKKKHRLQIRIKCGSRNLPNVRSTATSMTQPHRPRTLGLTRKCPM